MSLVLVPFLFLDILL